MKQDTNSKLRMALSMKLNLPVAADSVFTDLTANQGLSIETAKSILTWEAYLIKESDIGTICSPMSGKIFELCSDEGIIFELLQIFYGVYSGQILRDETEFDTEEILGFLKEAKNTIGFDALVKNPQRILEFLPLDSTLENVPFQYPQNDSEADNSEDIFTRRALLCLYMPGSKVIKDILRDAGETVDD